MTHAEDLAAEYASLNEALRKSHEAIADMRTERQLLTGLLAEVKAATTSSAEQMIEAELNRQLEALAPKVTAELDRAADAVCVKFDRFARILTGEDGPPGSPGLEKLLTKAKQGGYL